MIVRMAAVTPWLAQNSGLPNAERASLSRRGSLKRLLEMAVVQLPCVVRTEQRLPGAVPGGATQEDRSPKLRPCRGVAWIDGGGGRGGVQPMRL